MGTRLDLRNATLLTMLFFSAAVCLGILQENPEAGQAGPAKPMTLQGLPHAFELHPRLFSGGTPEGVEGLLALQKLGVATIINVDGSKSDLAQIDRLGLRVVHLPFGYDGISPREVARLIRAMDDSPGPVYLHCHHGQHRGPAASALLARARLGWTVNTAENWLKQAGTSARYPGLFESVRGPLPDATLVLAVLPGELPRVAQVPELVDRMVEIDSHFDRLLSFLEPGKQPSASEFTRETELLRELLNEVGRPGAQATLPTEKQNLFLKFLAGSLLTVDRLILETRKPEPEKPELTSAIEAVRQSCTSCHTAVRN